MNKQVALVGCPAYDNEKVFEVVRRAVGLLGGMEQLVTPGQRVLVKPNLLLPSDPDRAIVTHPAVVRAVVMLAQEAGGHVVIADNPVVPPAVRLGWQKAYERTGWAAVAAETGAELNTSIMAQQIAHPTGVLLKRVDTSSFLSEADVVISVPKLKTHGFMRFTGGVKNLFGTVPGTTKFGYHVKLQDSDQFAEMLLDLVSFVRPALTVMDAVVGMDGDGPSAGDPFPIGAILAGADPVAVDVAALDLVGQEPASVPTVAAAIRRGWSTGCAQDLVLLGDEAGSLRVEGFRMPAGQRSEMERLPGFLRGFATRLLVANPVVTGNCTGCNLCVESCPVNTIDRSNGRALIDLEHCIRCYCCHELCPESAIELRQSRVTRALARFGR